MTEEKIIKYILEETTPDEVQQMEEWLSKSQQNRREFESVKFIWDESKKLEKSISLDTENAWRRFELLKSKRETEAAIGKPGKVRLLDNGFFKVAAACLILGLSVFAYLFFQQQNGVIYSHGRTLITTLPDQSVVTLNKKSSLSLEPSFNKEKRQLTLTGEAFFKVAPNVVKPFEVRIDQVTVLVVGTSFNVKADESGVEIIVESGIVKVYSQNDTVRILANQKVKIGNDGKEIMKALNDDPVYQYYYSDEIVCNHTPLHRLVEVLNNTFNANIEIADPVAGRMEITSRFEKKDLPEILEVISKTLGVRIEKSTNKIIIYAQ